MQNKVYIVQRHTKAKLQPSDLTSLPTDRRQTTQHTSSSMSKNSILVILLPLALAAFFKIATVYGVANGDDKFRWVVVNGAFDCDSRRCNNYKILSLLRITYRYSPGVWTVFWRAKASIKTVLNSVQVRRNLLNLTGSWKEGTNQI